MRFASILLIALIGLTTIASAFQHRLRADAEVETTR